MSQNVKPYAMSKRVLNYAVLREAAGELIENILKIA